MFARPRPSFVLFAACALLLADNAIAQCTITNVAPGGAPPVPPNVTFQWSFSGGADPDHFDIRWEPTNPPGPPQVGSVPGFFAIGMEKFVE